MKDRDPLLDEAQAVERAIGRVRLGAAALALVLGPAFPNLTVAGVIALGIAVGAYNVVALAASARARTRERHERVARLAFAADVAALCVAMFLFSADPFWTTYLLGPLVITISAFRFGTRGAVAGTLTVTLAYVGIAVFRTAYFGYDLGPQRIAFTVSVFALSAILLDRVLRELQRLRGEREALIRDLERRVAEDAALAQATRIVANVAAPDIVVPAVVRAARSVLRFDRATVFVADDERGEYRVLHRMPSGEGAAPPAPRIALGEGLIGEAIRQERTLLVPDLLRDPRYTPGTEGERSRSVILVPLRVAGRHVAVFTLSRELPEAFGPDDVRLSEAVAALVGQVLENQRLFAEASQAEALRALDQLKDEFLAAVSHELRTPLTVVSGAIELLSKRREDLPDPLPRLVDQAERNVARLQRDVEELLEIAKLQDTRIELDRAFIPCATLLEDVAALHAPLAAAREQTIVVRRDAAGLPPALVDRRRMQRLLANLVSNAIRYGRPGATVELSADIIDGEMRFAVTDEGPGIPADERDRVFERFYRLERDRTGTEGTGLGLAIAKRLAELHGGRIWIEDAAGGGCRFVVAIPHEASPVEVAS